MGRRERNAQRKAEAERIAERVRRPRRRVVRDRVGFIYFLQEGAHGPVKIGFTTHDPRTRLMDAQVGNPRTLRLLGWRAGSLSEEVELHARLGGPHIRGEWFRPTQPVLAEVARCDDPPSLRC